MLYTTHTQPYLIRQLEEDPALQAKNLIYAKALYYMYPTALHGNNLEKWEEVVDERWMRMWS